MQIAFYAKSLNHRHVCAWALLDLAVVTQFTLALNSCANLACALYLSLTHDTTHANVLIRQVLSGALGKHTPARVRSLCLCRALSYAAKKPFEFFSSHSHAMPTMIVFSFVLFCVSLFSQLKQQLQRRNATTKANSKQKLDQCRAGR